MSEVENEKPSHLQKLETHISEQEAMLKINDIDLNPDFLNQPPNYMKACMRYHRATQLVSMHRQKLLSTESETYFKIKNSGEKTTENFLGQAVKNDADVQTQRNVVIQAEYQASVYQSLVRAWEQKKDMLIQVGSNQRAEMNAGVQINKPPQPASGENPFVNTNQNPNQL